MMDADAIAWAMMMAVKNRSIYWIRTCALVIMIATMTGMMYMKSSTCTAVQTGSSMPGRLDGQVTSWL